MALLLGVLKTLKTTLKLRFDGNEQLDPGESPKTADALLEDRHKALFIFRRAESIGRRHTDFGQSQIVSRVQNQLSKVDEFIKKIIGPAGPLNGYVDTSTPGGKSTATNQQAFTWTSKHHFDLENIAMTEVGRPSQKREAVLLRNRWVAVRSIVWGAAGLHDELWSENGDGAGLVEAKLQEVLDRRLRTIERMVLQINGTGKDKKEYESDGPRGEWRDGSRLRVFEYSDFPLKLVSTSDISVIWRQIDKETVRYETFLGILPTATRFEDEPVTPSPHWKLVNGDDYPRVPAANVSIAEGVDVVLQSQLDVWKRGWAYCDHAVTATHLEALRFAMERQGKGPNDFDALVRPKQVTLSGIMKNSLRFDADGVHTIDRERLWYDGVFTPSPPRPTPDDGVFDNLMLEFRDLQVGDHVMVWNHYLYNFVVIDGAWKLENSFVTRIDPVVGRWPKDGDPLVGADFMKPHDRLLNFSGFGLTGDYQFFLTELLKNFEGGFKAMYVLIKKHTKPPSGPDHFVVANTMADTLVIQWSPYATGLGNDPLPWFIFLPRILRHDETAIWPNVLTMQKNIKNSIFESGEDRGDDYQAPPETIQVQGESEERDLTDGVFFPLYLPKVAGRAMPWDEYFKLRRDSPSVVPAKMTPIQLSWDLLPGLFRRGANQPMQVLRPRVRP